MRLLWLESRKTICRRYVLLALTLFLLLDILKIGMDYSAGKIREVAGNTPEMQAGFAKIYEKCKGPITEETAGFLASEYKRLCAEKADGTYRIRGWKIQRLCLWRLVLNGSLFL